LVIFLIRTRFKQLLDAIGASNNELADELRVTPSAISDILHGRVKKFSGPMIELLRLKHNVNPDWLLTGQGEMFLPFDSAQGKPASTGSGAGPAQGPVRNGLKAVDGGLNPTALASVGDLDAVAETAWFKSLPQDRQMALVLMEHIKDDRVLRRIVEILEAQARVENLLDDDTDLAKKGNAG